MQVREARGMQVREARVADARRIAEISVRGWQEGYKQLYPPEFLRSLSVDESEARWRQRLVGVAPGAVLVCGEGEWLAGALSCGESRGHGACAEPGQAEIYTLYVDPEHWGRGCGKLLCEAACARLAAAGFREVVLWVLAANEPSRRFYERVGFELEPERRGFFEFKGHALPDVRYRRSL